MTTDDIIRMAKEAGAFAIDDFVEAGEIDILRFANLVAAAEREACAKLCEPKSIRPCDCDRCDCGNSGDMAAVVDWDASNALAAAIRARGKE